MIRQFKLIAFLCLLQESQAWVTTTKTTTTSKSTSPAAFDRLHEHTHRHSSSTTQLLASSSSFSSNEEEPSTSSRRQWFTNIAAAAAATASATSGIVCLPANAADVVTAKSICDPTVSIWKKDGRVVYLLGTAHISAASAELAGNLVKDIHPTGVFVELDPKRVRGSGILAKKVDLENGSEEQGPTSKVIVPNIQLAASNSGGATAASSGSSEMVATSAPPSSSSPPAKKPSPMMRAASAAVGSGIRGMYKKLDSSGFKAGEEFTVAIREGQKIGSDIVLGDRDVEVTLNRLAEGLSKTDLSVLLNPDSELEQSLKELLPDQAATAGGVAAANGDLSDEEFREEFSTFVEVMKTKENVRKIMFQLQKAAPALYEALVSERDAYMAAGLNGLNELETIVAVMGIAHVDGVETNLMNNGWKSVTPTCA